MVSQKNEKKDGNKWVDMIAFPPVLLLPVLLMAMIIRSQGHSSLYEGIPSSVSVTIIFAYAALSIAYMTLLKKAHRKAARGAATMADGILLVFVSAQLDAGASLGWGGAFLVLIGLGVTISQLTPPQAARFAKITPDLLPETIGKQDIKTFISSIPFPTAFLQKDENTVERVVAANEAFATVIGRTGAKFDGVPFSEIISPNMESRALVFADAEWVSHRTSKGKQTLFMLSPSVKLPEAPPVVGDNAVVDADTGLYTPYYMKYKAESDVQMCRRYKKRLAVISFQLEFESKALIVPSDEAKLNAFIAFTRMISISIRACDTAYKTGENEIVIFLPEASQASAKSVVGRLGDNVRKLAKVECAELGVAKLVDTCVNFIGDEILSVDQVMQELYIAMGRSDK